jgi:hypothetical protein
MRCRPKGSARSAVCAVVAVGALAASAEAARAEVAASGDPALYWNQVLATGLAGPPVVQTRSYAMVSTAIHDAVNATVGFPDYSFIGGVATSGGDTRAATAVAAYNVLVAINPAKTADYTTALNASLALVPDGAAKTSGIATGTAIAAATLGLRANDGSTAVPTYSPTGTVGHWAPTPPALAPAVAAQWADVTPWVMTSPDQFRPAAPPSIGSLAYAMAYNEVMDIGSATSGTRSADQTAAALFWAGTAGVQQWVQSGVSIAETQGLSTIENARLFALLNVSVADALIGVWDSKFEYDLWRPITAIRTDDGNPLTAADPNWSSLINAPAYPGYAGGLSGVAGASSAVLAAFLGDDHNFCVTAGANTRCWTSFSEAALDGANSRLWGGIHFRFDNEAGLLIGEQVANYVLASNAFDAVPEPATWAMMIVGFGMAGAVMRRRRALLSA